MKVDIIISADYIREDIIKDKIVVVIDMFRATSVIVTAIMNGCKDVILASTVEEAFKIKSSLNESLSLLGGERNAIKIDGFDLSNSPIEYSKEVIKDKTLIFTTTNGTRTLLGCSSGKKVLIGSMLNGSAVARKLLKENMDVVIVNAGTKGQFSMDDFICGGFIINVLCRKNPSIELTDISKTALKMYKGNLNILDYIKDATHYEVMLKLGLEKDIEYCIQKDITDIVPECVEYDKYIGIK